MGCMNAEESIVKRKSRLRKQRQALRVSLAVASLLVIACTGRAADYYIAPDGSDATGDGTIGSPYETIMKAQDVASSDDTVYLRGGTYYLDNSDLSHFINPRDIVNYITKNGIRYIAYAEETPIFDFSNVQPVGHRVSAFYITADNCVFEGFEVVGVQVTIEDAHTQSECFLIRGGDNNRFERLSMHDGMGIGWYLLRGGNNLVINCDAYNNKGLNGNSHGNIDGFGAHADQTSNTGNMFIGCRAWFNSDDGFDLINNDSAVTISNCWAMNNGYDYESPSSKIGDSTGFKAGGYGVSGGSYPTPVPRNRVINCLALGNSRGFYANHHTGGLDWIGNTAIDNGVNYNMLCNLDASSRDADVDGFDHYMKNNLGYGGNSEVTDLGTDPADDNDVTYNYWTLPVTVTSGDFVSLNQSLLTQPRQSDGSLPEVDYARLVEGSDLIDAGLDIGYSFNGTAPDLGAFESGMSSNPPPPVVTSPLELSANADTACRFNDGANGDQDRNYGTIDTIYLRQLDGAPRDYFAYVRFDLSDIPSPITNATFTLVRSSGDVLSGGIFRVLGLDHAAGNTDQNWSEASVTFNGLGAEIDTSIYPAPSNGESPFDLDRVTDFEAGASGATETIVGNTATLSGPAFAAWLESRRNDGGLATLVVDYPARGDTSDGNISYYTREATANEPMLTVEFDDGMDPASDPSINSISVSNTTVTVSWDSDTRGTYRIESKTNLMQSMWSVVSSATNLAGGPGNHTAFPFVGADSGFFRIYGE